MIEGLAKGKESLRVIILEDEEIIVEHLSYYLNASGHKVLGVVNSASLLHQAIEAHDEVDIVIADVNLGSKPDGIDIAINIRKTRKIPFIFLTGLSDGETLDRIKASDAFGYISKPFKPHELLASVELAVVKNRSIEQLEISHDQLMSVLGSIGEGIVVINRQEKVVFFNDAAGKIFELTSNAVLGADARSVIPVIYKSKAGTSN